MSTETWLLLIGLLGILVLVGAVLRVVMKNAAPNTAPLERLFEQAKQDREARYREVESLRKELRDQTESMQRQIDRFNRSVDTRLGESAKQLNERLDKSSSVIGHLQKELGKMGEVGANIESLHKILRAPKGRGGMGETSLEEILRTELPQTLWDRQYNLGAQMVVDAVVKTANGIIPIDAKFPLPAFEAMMNAENVEAQEAAQKQFQSDVKKRITEVAKYIRPDQDTIGFAMLYIPSENIYYEAAIRDNVLPNYAKEKKVLLCGPNNMVYVLKLLLQAYQSQEFAKEAQRALSEIAGVQKQAEVLEEDLTILGKHINNAQGKFGDVQSANQKLQNQIHTIHALKSEEDIASDDSEQTTLLS